MPTILATSQNLWNINIGFLSFFIFGTLKVYYHNILLWCRRLQWWSGRKHTNTLLCLNMVFSIGDRWIPHVIFSWHFACPSFLMPWHPSNAFFWIVPMLLLTTKIFVIYIYIYIIYF
jgi:hypothetical protein